MRGSVDGLASPYSFGALLPAVYQEDDFAMRLMAAFDEVLAPCVSTIDNIEHYFDPELAPADFVEMLAAWVGVELDETWSEQSRRALVNEAVALYRERGTVAGLKRHVQIYAGVEPEIEESGGCAVSLTSGGELPGSNRPLLVVRVRVADPSALDERRLSRLVASSKPAHLPHRVEVLGPEHLPGEQAPAERPAAQQTREAPAAIAEVEDGGPQGSARQPAEPGEEPPMVEPSGLPAAVDAPEAALPEAALPEDGAPGAGSPAGAVPVEGEPAEPDAPAPEEGAP